MIILSSSLKNLINSVSGSSATIYAYIGEFHTSKNRDRAIMIASTLYGFGTIFMSILAWLIINQEWSFYIPGIGINYKPWRLYLVACALPGLICGLILFALPESPKYLLSVGRDEEALEIIKYIYEKNTKKSRDSFPVSRLLKEPNDQEMTTVEGEGNFCSTLCKSIWDQTAPLFNRQFVWLTLLICFLQFVVFSTANGMYMWFPDILNSVMEYNKENPDNSTYICEIYKEKIGQVFSGSHHGTACVEKFEISTYIYSIYVEVGYILGFAVISGFIKIVHKKYIIGKISHMVFKLVLYYFHHSSFCIVCDWSLWNRSRLSKAFHNSEHTLHNFVSMCLGWEPSRICICWALSNQIESHVCVHLSYVWEIGLCFRDLLHWSNVEGLLWHLVLCVWWEFNFSWDSCVFHSESQNGTADDDSRRCGLNQMYSHKM